MKSEKKGEDSLEKKGREYLEVFKTGGEDSIYKSIIGYGMKKASENKNIEIEILNESEEMLKLYRRTEDERFLILSKILRKAAHVIHRQLLVIYPNKKTNRKRFLVAV